MSATYRPPSSPPVLIPIADAAALIPCSAFSLATPGWRLKHRIPHYRVAGRIMFSAEELAAWREARRVALSAA